MDQNQPAQSEQKESKSNGALLGSVIVILILIIGGIYLAKTIAAKKAAEKAQEPEVAQPQ